jgi:pimeloyl-ACP methyl ester carboxylesterase
MQDEIAYLSLADRRLAYQHRRAAGGGKAGIPLFFLGGYASDMSGTKASYLDARCAASGRGYLRFDYGGHGKSDGKFTDGTIGSWFEDALAVLDRLTEGPQILVGSSMGGWIALLLARARPERVAGFVGVAAAPDFTEDLVRPRLSPAQRAQLEREGLTCDEDAPPDFRAPMTARLLDEARNHLVLRGPFSFNAPVRLLQGQCDAEVPWGHALRLAERLTGEDVRVTLVKDGDHRLGRPQDLDLLWREVEGLTGKPEPK